MQLSFSRQKTPLQQGAIIPIESVITKYGPPGVFVLKDGRAAFTLVQLLGSDLHFAEVIGIPKGTTIIKKKKKKIRDGQILEKRP